MTGRVQPLYRDVGLIAEFRFDHRRPGRCSIPPRGLEDLCPRGVRHQSVSSERLTVPCQFRLSRHGRHHPAIGIPRALAFNRGQGRILRPFDEGQSRVGRQAIPLLLQTTRPAHLDGIDNEVHPATKELSVTVLGHVIAPSRHLPHLLDPAGPDMDEGTDGMGVRQGAHQLEGQTGRPILIRVAQHLSVCCIAVTDDVGGPVVVKVQLTKAVQLVLLIGPILDFIREARPTSIVHVQVVVVRIGIWEAVGRHHQILHHVPIQINGQGSPTILEGGHSCQLGNIGEHPVIVPLVDIGVVLDVGHVHVPIPIVVWVAQGGGHGLDGHIGPHVLRDVVEHPIDVAVECIGEDRAVIDDPEVLIPVFIIIKPGALKGVLQPIAHPRLHGLIRKETIAIVAKHEVLIAHGVHVVVVAGHEQIEIIVLVVIHGRDPTNIPARPEWHSPVEAVLHETAVLLLHVQEQPDAQNTGHEVQVSVVVDIDPQHRLRLHIMIEGRVVLQTIRSPAIQFNRAVRRGGGDIVPPISVEVGAAQTATKPTGRRRGLNEVVNGHVLQLPLGGSGDKEREAQHCTAQRRGRNMKHCAQVRHRVDGSKPRPLPSKRQIITQGQNPGHKRLRAVIDNHGITPRHHVYLGPLPRHPLSHLGLRQPRPIPDPLHPKPIRCLHAPHRITIPMGPRLKQDGSLPKNNSNTLCP